MNSIIKLNYIYIFKNFYYFNIMSDNIMVINTNKYYSKLIYFFLRNKIKKIFCKVYGRIEY